MESYITLLELNTLVEELFDEDDELADVGWSTRSDKSKNVHLGNAMRAVESLRYFGRKADISIAPNGSPNQPLKFPLFLGNTSEVFIPLASVNNSILHTGIPEALKKCVAHLTILSMQEAKSSRVKLQRVGVIAISNSGIREDYRSDPELMSGTVPRRIQELYLKRYLFNGISG
jgi:hypothetical protein